MATCIRLKRKLDEEPADAIVVVQRRKRQRVTEGCGDEDEDVKTLLKFAATVKAKDERVEDHLEKALNQGTPETAKTRRKRAAADSFVTPAVSSKSKIYKSETNYQLISVTTASSSHEGGGDVSEESLFHLYDAEQCGVEKLQDPATNSGTEVVTCNGVPMRRHLLDHDYVYDLYFCSDVGDQLLQQPVTIEHYLNDEQLEEEAEGGSDEGGMDDDDDSNDEGNWRNDYPDEDEDFYKDYDYYREFDEMDETMLNQFADYRIGSDDDTGDNWGAEDDEFKPDEKDEIIFGSAYAAFKAKLKKDLTLEENGEDEGTSEVQSDSNR